jgi:hypothetical protein
MAIPPQKFGNLSSTKIRATMRKFRMLQMLLEVQMEMRLRTKMVRITQAKALRLPPWARENERKMGTTKMIQRTLGIPVD